MLSLNPASEFLDEKAVNIYYTFLILRFWWTTRYGEILVKPKQNACGESGKSWATNFWKENRGSTSSQWYTGN